MGRLGFPKSCRLRKRAEFTACYDHGRRYHTRQFLVFVRRRDEAATGARLGIAVSKKIGSAVVRNRVKRLVREVFRQNRSLITSDLDVVVVAKRKIDVPSLDVFVARDELIPIFRRLGRDFRPQSENV
ncbi:ribonuclease P protein component [Desulfovibrio inopinatus]|uniref:ribonuclease P protein component n=1 Tax=Desulfovibrio inopinatus TaxID=102109 RepID=UPI000486C760